MGLFAPKPQRMRTAEPSTTVLSRVFRKIAAARETGAGPRPLIIPGGPLGKYYVRKGRPVWEKKR